MEMSREVKEVILVFEEKVLMAEEQIQSEEGVCL
jgi:hypothetical protein